MVAASATLSSALIASRNEKALASTNATASRFLGCKRRPWMNLPAHSQPFQPTRTSNLKTIPPFTSNNINCPAQPLQNTNPTSSLPEVSNDNPIINQQPVPILSPDSQPRTLSRPPRRHARGAFEQVESSHHSTSDTRDQLLDTEPERLVHANQTNPTTCENECRTPYTSGSASPVVHRISDDASDEMTPPSHGILSKRPQASPPPMFGPYKRPRVDDNQETIPTQPQAGTQIIPGASPILQNRDSISLQAPSNAPNEQGEGPDHCFERLETTPTLSMQHDPLANDVLRTKNRQMKKALQIFLTNLLGVSRQQERGRLSLLVQACEIEDYYFVALHQIFCLYTVIGGKLPGFKDEHVRGLNILSSLLSSNLNIPSKHLTYYASLPGEPLSLLHSSAEYRRHYNDAQNVLAIFSRAWDGFQKACFDKGRPPFAYEIAVELGVCSVILQGVIFRAQLRLIWGKETTEHSCQLEDLFKENQDKHRTPANSSTIANVTAEYQHLEQQFRQLHEAHKREVQSRYPPQENRNQTCEQHSEHIRRPQDTPPLPSMFIPQSQQRFPANSQSCSTYQTPYVQAPSNLQRNVLPVSNGGFVQPWNAQVRQNGSQPVLHPAPVVVPSQRVSPGGRFLRNNQAYLSPIHLIPVADAIASSPNGPKDPGRCALHQILAQPLVSKVISNDNYSNVRFFQYMIKFLVVPYDLSSVSGSHSLKFRVQPTDIHFRATEAGHIQDGSYTYRFRCIKILDGRDVKLCTEEYWTIKDTAWPRHIALSLNNNTLEICRARHHNKDLPVDVTQLLKEGDNFLNIYQLSVAAETNPKLKFALALEVIVTESEPRIRTKISNFSRPLALSEISKSLSTAAEKDDDIAIIDDHISIDLIDPFTALIFETPVRGKFCQHRECFDLTVFLESRLSQEGITRPDEWKCPICKADARPKSLICDLFLSEVRQQLAAQDKLNARAIWVRKDGSWEAKLDDTTDTNDNKRSNEIKRSSTEPSEIQKQAEVIELD